MNTTKQLSLENLNEITIEDESELLEAFLNSPDDIAFFRFKLYRALKSAIGSNKYETLEEKLAHLDPYQIVQSVFGDLNGILTGHAIISKQRLSSEDFGLLMTKLKVNLEKVYGADKLQPIIARYLGGQNVLTFEKLISNFYESYTKAVDYLKL